MPHKDPEIHRNYQRNYQQAWRRRNPARVRQIHIRADLKRRYGITLSDYERLLSKQKNVCAICSRPNRDGHRLAVDHSHQIGKIRGLLCDKCNLILGQIGDDIEILYQMVFYIESNGQQCVS